MTGAPRPGPARTSLEPIYRKRASRHWRDRLRRLIEPPAPLVMNPAEPKDFPLGRWNLYIGGAGRRVDGYVNLDIAAVAGVDVVADLYPYDRASTNLGIRLPGWALAGGQIKERLADPATRRKIALEMRQNLVEMGEPDYGFATVARFASNPAYEGKTISEINVMKGRAPGAEKEIETIFDLMNAGGASMIYHLMSEADIERILRYPSTAIASDGGIVELGVGNPHPRSYGTNARVLADYVRARGVLTLEDAIRRPAPSACATAAWCARATRPTWCCSIRRACRTSPLTRSPTNTRRGSTSCWLTAGSWWTMANSPPRGRGRRCGTASDGPSPRCSPLPPCSLCF